MKITDKIVTSVTQPQQIYVVDATCGSIVWDFPVYWNNNVEPTVDVNTRNVFSIVDGIATFTTVSMSE